MEPKRPTSFRLTDEAKAIIATLAQRLGISQSAVIELLLRAEVHREGIPPNTSPTRKDLAHGE